MSRAWSCAMASSVHRGARARRGRSPGRSAAFLGLGQRPRRARAGKGRRIDGGLGRGWGGGAEGRGERERRRHAPQRRAVGRVGGETYPCAVNGAAARWFDRRAHGFAGKRSTTQRGAIRSPTSLVPVEIALARDVGSRTHPEGSRPVVRGLQRGLDDVDGPTPGPRAIDRACARGLRDRASRSLRRY